jgi:hypothetical protein
MVDRKAVWANRLLTSLLVLAGLMVAFLLYSFGVRVLAPRVDPGREVASTELVGPVIQIEVRNGCGVADLAAITTQYLRDHGFDVVETGNYERSDVRLSRVIDRVGDRESALKVARVLGIPEERVEEDLNPELYLDASVIIGMDYETLKPLSGD